MADTKKPIEEVSVEDAQAMFANAAKALGGTQGRSAGFRRVSIPVSEPVRPEPLSTEEAKTVVEEVIDGERYVAPSAPPARPTEPEKPQSERKAWYLKKRQKEEEESLPISKEKLRERKAAREAAEEFELGDIVEHAKFGKGEVIGLTESTVTVNFTEVGTKKLAKGIAPIKKV